MDDEEAINEEGPINVPRVRDASLCPCKSRMSYADCCMPYHKGQAQPETAEQLMRSRYSAFFFRLGDYLVASTHPDTRTPEMRADLEKLMPELSWSFLSVVGTAKGEAEDKVGKVEFIAEYYLEDELHKLHECSRFRRYKGAWKYYDDKG